MSVRRNISRFVAGLSLLALVGAGCGGPSTAQIEATTPVTLTMWGVFDNAAALSQVQEAYRKIHPNVSFAYRELRPEDYKKELLRAFAEGVGPDIFAIHNTWVAEYTSLIEPLPLSLKIPYAEVRGTIKKETIYTVKEEPTLSQRALKTEFVDVVAQDVLRPYKANAKAQTVNQIFGLPLSVDTLALYYNRDLLNIAGFPEPPATWSKFQEQVTKLTQLGATNSIVQSGAAIGTSKNVERASDILSVLMMQNGTQMTDDAGRATFARAGQDRAVLGADAVRFYTDFANPLKQVYTWNDAQPNSFDAFTQGKTAFFFGYSYHLPLLRAAAPKLKFSIAPVPQIEGGRTVNHANYWLQTVAKSSKNTQWAWDFIQFATSANQVPAYLSAANLPTARRALIAGQTESEDLSVFASQLLTASSWYRGKDTEAMEQAMNTLIDEVLKGNDPLRSIQNAENKVNQTY